jgi:hypothetical protein
MGGIQLQESTTATDDHSQSGKRITVRKTLRALAVATMLAVGVAILTFGIDEANAANRDTISYWATGQQLVHHRNPYDVRAIGTLEAAAGFHPRRSMLMRNAPSALFLALPLGFVAARTATILWALAMIASLMASIRLLLGFYGRPKSSVHLYCYLFPPVLACILEGQMGIFILFGVVLFLRFREDVPFLAGIGLIVLALKPHLLVPFGLTVLLWAVGTKAYRVLASAAATLAASCALSLWLDPHVWQEYTNAMRYEDIQNEFIPTFSLMFRVAVHVNSAWLQLVPVVVGSAWAVRFYWKNRHRWDWRTHGQRVLLVSVLVAPYAWVSDEAVLLPAILGSLYFAESNEVSLAPYLILSGIAMIEVMFGVKMNSGFYVWTTTAWLGWYSYAYKGAHLPAAPPPFRETGRTRFSE